MNTFLKIFLFLLLPSFAQSQAKRNPIDSLQTAARFSDYRAIHWGIEDGLSQGETNQMIKDMYGFLWIGTNNGLNRFDGTTFRIFYHDPSNPKSILNDFTLLGLNEDSLHNIWIGTAKGLTRYDIRADTFTNFLDDPGDYPFWATKNEMLCIEKASSIVSAYNIHSLRKKTLASLGPYTGMVSGPHHSVFDAATNSIWLLISDEPKKSFGLLQLNLSNGGKQVFSWPCYRKIPDHDHTSEAMCYDKKRNCIWINSNDGLLQFTLSDKHFHHIDALDKLPDLKGYEKGFDLSHWVGIDIDNSNRIWVATVRKGIVAYDPDAEIPFQPLLRDSSLAFDISDRNACVYCDRDGIVWCGSWMQKGIYQLNPFSAAVKTYEANPSDPQALSGAVVNDILKVDHGKLWIGTPTNGLNVFDPHTGSFEVLRKNDLPGIKEDTILGYSEQILPLAIDSLSQKAWLISNAIYEMDTRTKKCRPVIFKDGSGRQIHTHQFHGTCAYKNGFMECIHWQNQKSVFVGDSNSKQGVFVVNSDSNIAHMLFSLPWDTAYFFPTLAQNDHLLFLKAARNPAANLTFSNHGGKWVRTSTPLDSILWERVFYNKIDQSFWVVAFQKLIHYDKNFRVISEYTKSNGLPDIPIFSLIFDKHNNVWFNTDRSIHELNTTTGTILSLSEKDGFQRQNFSSDYTPVAKDDDGDLYFAVGFYGNGFYRIDPDKFVSPRSFVYLHSIRINDKRLPLSTGVNNLQTLSLNYFQNKMTIETGVIDYYSKGKNQIRYKLEGLNNAWQYAPAYYTIRLDGLRPASYKLIIQAANASNEFNGPQKILTIIISPPFWETWWFRTLAVLMLIALIYSIVQYRSRNLKKRNVELEGKVMHRTKELKHSLEDLRATQAQLIQQEKMASLGELTAGIAHEIQNPLNFVNNFSDLNKELADELEQEIHKGNYDDARTIAKDIKENEEKINRHGKRAGAIVKGMLQHSRTSSGQRELTDLNKLADEYLRLTYHGLRAKDKSFDAKIETDFDSSVDKINVVPQDIGRVIVNLINNAFYAIGERQKAEGLGYEPLVIVSTKKQNDKVEITVKDNGNGIPQKIVDKIFQPFFTTKPTGQGTGLGLSLAYDIVKAHGGEIKVQSKEGEGSEFTVVLPA